MTENKLINSTLKTKSISINYIKDKKGFTLVELVVVIAVMAVLAAISIPVFASNIKSAAISQAETNAKTIEASIKEAMIFVENKGNSKYANVQNSIIKVSYVASVNSIEDAFKPVEYFGNKYYPVWCKGNVYFAIDQNGDGIISKSDKDIRGNALPDSPVMLYDSAKKVINETDISTLSVS